jgi:hypothetical protein
LEHALFDKRLQAFDLAPKARIRHPNFLKNCVLGPSGPKIKAKAVQETVLEVAYAAQVAREGRAGQFARAPANRAGAHL